MYIEWELTDEFTKRCRWRSLWGVGDSTDTSTENLEMGTEAESSETQELSQDDRFDLLSNHRRRYTLHYIKHNGEQATLGELSDQIAAWENEIGIEEVGYDERKRVYTSLQQVHLPRMDEAGVVEFDDREGTVEIGPAAEDLDVYLEVVEGNDIPWSVFYLGLSGLNLLAVIAYAVGVPVVSALPEAGLAVFVLTTFLVASLAHLYVTRTEMRLGEQEQPPELSE